MYKKINLLMLSLLISGSCLATTITIIDEKGTNDGISGGKLDYDVIDKDGKWSQAGGSKSFTFSKVVTLPDNAKEFLIAGYSWQKIKDGATYRIKGFAESKPSLKSIELIK